MQFCFFKVLGKCLWSNTAVKTQAHWISINVPINTDKDYLSILHFLNPLLQKEVIQNLIFKVTNTMTMSWWKKYGRASETLSISPRFYQATCTSGPRWLWAHVPAIHKCQDLINLICMRYLALKPIDCNLNPFNTYLMLGIYLQPHTLSQPRKTMGPCGDF